MSNRWIISDYNFRQHYKLKSATKELKRLQAAHPDKTFSIYRIKGRLQPSDAPKEIKRLKQQAATLASALEVLIYATMYKDHPSESDIAIKALKDYQENVR
jgi:hypothetical protein